MPRAQSLSPAPDSTDIASSSPVVHHRIINCFWEITQHRLLAGVIGDLRHYRLVFR
ncbi:TPA: hypothetical protein MYO83_000381 [Klebsiella michiganensis]|nr:hypothetical protein [Klebsiella michiganensis]HCB1844788.1 hypothetical protein [Klebsiella oxytoca]